jgi:hypothetical protein
MDERITQLNTWQRRVYDLCWKAGLAEKNSPDAKMYGAELERLQAERFQEYEQAVETWTKIMYEVMY